MKRIGVAGGTGAFADFTRETLAEFDGRHPGRPILVAAHGRVYDVSRSTPWHKGRHWGCARAGRDQSERLAEAPHGPEMLERVACVGRLVDTAAEEESSA